jgi:phosphoglycerate kinase
MIKKAISKISAKKKDEVKSIRDCTSLRGKKILLRSDFNVPIKAGKIQDDYKIVASLPTIRFLVRYGCKVVMVTHLGQPKEKDKKYSTKPIATYLSKKLGMKVKHVDDCVGLKARQAVAALKEGEILLLENIRFEKAEETNDKIFAKRSSGLS